MKYPEHQINKYVTKLMEVVYTPEELRDGYIIEGKSSSKRTPLDSERYELIKSKYRDCSLIRMTREQKKCSELSFSEFSIKWKKGKKYQKLINFRIKIKFIKTIYTKA
jgi:hypothetical protein